MKRNGVTIFMSSHNLSEVQKYCDHIGIIKKGKLIAVESIESMQSKQLHKVKVMFERPISNFTLPVKGVRDLEVVAKDHYTFEFEGNMNELLMYLAKYKIADIELVHSDLDEIFEKYYN
jgi:ABC-2 type transport system ATP-binding protein